ncbi:MAG: hypothetical protein J1G04_00810 [Clostridiales bacterium]|nr:hypothetical protein [Clostridiales bacterium]
MKNVKQKNIGNKFSRNKLAVIIITAVMSVAAVVLLVVLLAMHADPELTKIEITTPPDKTEYIEKQTLDTTGLVVKAYYKDDVVEIFDYSVDKSVLELGDDTVTVSYTNRKKTKTATFGISVIEKSFLYIEVTRQPEKTVYVEGSIFDPSGIEVTAYYNNGESAIVYDWVCNSTKALSVSDKSVTISYGGMTAEIPIIVEQKHLQELYIDRLPNKLRYTEGEYFDFLGLVLYAKHDNAPDERVYDWQLDAIKPLTVADTSVSISYTLHNVTKYVVIDIEVVEAEHISDAQRLLSELLKLLPQVDRLCAEDLGALNYVISVLSETELSEEQQKLMDELCAKRDELLAELPDEPEKYFNIVYEIGGGLVFEDINFGDNPTRLKEGEVFELKAAFSDTAEKQGYEFTGWSMDGEIITSIINIGSDKTVYAIFTLTSTVELIFKDRESNEELLVINPLRTDSYNFDSEGVSSVIVNRKGVLPIAYYSSDNDRIDSIDLNRGSSLTVYVLTVTARELHLPDENLFTVGWKYEFVIGQTTDETISVARTGSVFRIPIGAQVTITATNANIDSIVLDGVSIGTRLNATIVNAVFTMTGSEYPASVTYTTKLTDMTTLSFVGQNIHSVVYPIGWNGIMADIDLERLAFIFDEDNNNYLNVYHIHNNEYYFEDLKSYVFSSDTVISVSKLYNDFTLTIKYANGQERLDDIVGKQTLRSAISEFDANAVSTLNLILDTSNLFTDGAMTQLITKDELLSIVVRKNILVYSDWVLTPQQPEQPSYEPVDYSEYSFVNTWTSLFVDESDILSCELVLTVDGNYSYSTFVNGLVSANAYGIYRFNNGKIDLKTFVSAYEYDIFSQDDLPIDISFSVDGLLLTKFIRLDGTQKTVFEQVLFCGAVRPINYSAIPYIGSYDIDGITITLLENGTAIISIPNEQIVAYYRIGEDGKVYLMDNSAIGTGDITNILEEHKR